MKRRASIPGRINIIGEHTDYSGGCSLAFASQHRLVLEAQFVEAGYRGEPTVVALWEEAGGPPAHLEVTSSIPIGKGMSSSAALCLSIVLCVHGRSIGKQAACEEAQRLEHVVLGTPCGLLDQMTMMHSLEGRCVLIDFSTKTTTTISRPSDWIFKLVDSGIHRTLNSKDYRTTSTNETKRLHVESENQRVKEAMNSDSETLGKLLNETHESLETIGVSTPEVDALVASLQSTKGVLGARMMGGGFGGMILVLVENESILPDYETLTPSRPGFVEELL
ncbi:MAG: Galactokinase [Candidatus Poseidoniaceae archaeon]|nr:MAG: Galactokinase [Candidatus Poseidoniaceae archaeon]